MDFFSLEYEIHFSLLMCANFFNFRLEMVNDML